MLSSGSLWLGRWRSEEMWEDRVDRQKPLQSQLTRQNSLSLAEPPLLQFPPVLCPKVKHANRNRVIWSLPQGCPFSPVEGISQSLDCSIRICTVCFLGCRYWPQACELHRTQVPALTLYTPPSWSSQRLARVERAGQSPCCLASLLFVQQIFTEHLNLQAK